MSIEVTDRTARVADPIPVTIRLRPPERTGLADRFEASDPSPGFDVTRNPRIARLLRNRKFQFLLIVPNQIIFWTVIFVGFLGTAVPGLNFGTAITWYVWFCLVFVLMVVAGRAWCAMCPFGGLGEWIQRRTFWQRTQKTFSLGRKFPEPEVCLTCKTKDCMRGGDEGFGCPWYTWPGSADSNLSCGLCTECFKACP